MDRSERAGMPAGPAEVRVLGEQLAREHPAGAGASCSAGILGERGDDPPDPHGGTRTHYASSRRAISSPTRLRSSLALAMERAMSGSRVSSV